MKNSFQLFRAVCSSIGDKNFNGNKLIYALVTHDRCSMTFQNMSTALKHCLLSYANVSRCFLLIKQNPVLILYHHRHRQLYFFILPFSCPLRQWNAVKQQKKTIFFKSFNSSHYLDGGIMSDGLGFVVSELSWSTWHSITALFSSIFSDNVFASLHFNGLSLTRFPFYQ